MTQKNQGHILVDDKLFNKFCEKENKIFGCQDAFGCNIACPLFRARLVEFLYNEKGMTIGEAHKASVRMNLTTEEENAALRAIFDSGKATISMKELEKVFHGKIDRESKD